MAEETKPTIPYTRAIGRRKRAVAQIRLIEKGSGVFTVNGRPMADYFTVVTLRDAIKAPFKALGLDDKFDMSAKVSGGGIHGQADGVRLGVARALIKLNPEYRLTLKKLGFLTRDARKRERKKFGLKGARRAPQWSKR